MGIKIPQYFPKNDESWKQYFRIDTKKCTPYLYTDKEGNILFVVYVDRSQKSGKKVYQGSRANGLWVKENLWTKLEGYKLPLYRSHVLANTTKPIALGEGESVVEHGQSLFPQFEWTTFQGGRTAWRPSHDEDGEVIDKIDWSLLHGREVYIVSDIDADGKGKREFAALSRYLTEFKGVNAKFVNLPTFSEIQKWYEEEHGEQYEKKSHDIADGFLEEFTKENFLERIKSAKPTKPLPEYHDIFRDLIKHKWYFIASSGKLFYDVVRDRYAKAEEIDNLYKRDKNLRVKASSWLNSNNIPWVDQQTFRPGGDLIIYENGLRLLNKYRKPKFPYIEKDDLKDISKWRNHIKHILANDDPKIFRALEDIIAHDIRFPGKNRTFAVILFSGQGVGKTMFFNGLQKLYGEKNCSDLSIDQLVGRYQPFMLNSNYLFINEIDSTGKDVKSKQAMLRSLISDTNFLVEMKGIDLIPISNCSYTIWGATNESVPIYTPKDDRRTMFIDIATTRFEVLERNPNYYSELAQFINDPLSMANVYHYYKNVHVISKDFTINEAPRTSAKAELIEASKPQYMKTLDTYLELPRDKQPIASLQRDIVNVKQLAKDLSYSEREDIKKEFYTENKVLRWIRYDPNNFRVLKGEPYTIPESKVRGRCWVIRNHKFWAKHKDEIDMINAHFNKKIETLNLFDGKEEKDEYEKVPF